VQEWAQIRYLHASEGLSIRAIAARLGISRDTVSRAIASESPPWYQRVSGPSAFDEFEPLVRGRWRSSRRRRRR
jgi:IS30 family transposase